MMSLKHGLRRVLAVCTLLACLTACFVGLTVTASAEAEFAMEIPYGKPTVDGVIDEVGSEGTV